MDQWKRLCECQCDCVIETVPVIGAVTRYVAPRYRDCNELTPRCNVKGLSPACLAAVLTLISHSLTCIPRELNDGSIAQLNAIKVWPEINSKYRQADYVGDIVIPTCQLITRQCMCFIAIALSRNLDHRSYNEIVQVNSKRDSERIDILNHA